MSVSLIIRSPHSTAVGLLLCVRRTGYIGLDIDRLLHCRRAVAAAPQLSGKCEQCHVDSRRRKLNTDLFRNGAPLIVQLIGVYLLFTGDSLTQHRGYKFSTRDQDNDLSPTGSCAVTYKGAWWYKKCHASNLNGAYLRGNHSSYADGVEWYAWTGHHYSLRFTEMKIRPFHL